MNDCEVHKFFRIEGTNDNVYEIGADPDYLNLVSIYRVDNGKRTEMCTFTYKEAKTIAQTLFAYIEES